MKSQMTRKGDTLIVTIQGMVDYETQEPFKEELKKLLRPSSTDSAPRKIIFNMESLEFVGSSGISNLVQTLREFQARLPVRPSYVGARPEFQKVFRAFAADEIFDFFEDEDQAASRLDQ